MVEPAARNVSRVTSDLFSAVAAPTQTQVTAANTMNQYPNSGESGLAGIGALPVDSHNAKIPNAIQNAPHMPWTAVATPSLALNAHIPARNCASPPKIAANGTSNIAV